MNSTPYQLQYLCYSKSVSDVTFEENTDEFIKQRIVAGRERRGGIVGFLLRRNIAKTEAAANVYIFLFAISCLLVTILILLNFVFHVSLKDFFTDSKEREAQALEALPQDIQEKIKRIRQ